MPANSSLLNKVLPQREGTPPQLVSVGSEGERSEPERTTEANCGGRPVAPPPAPAFAAAIVNRPAAPAGGTAMDSMNSGAEPNPEVVEHPTRRRFTADYKRRILAEVDANPDLAGKIVRREGLYSSHLTAWRKLRDEGQLAALEPKKRGPKLSADRPLRLENAKLKRDNVRLNKKLQRAELIIDLQKKVSQILGVTLPALEETDQDEI